MIVEEVLSNRDVPSGRITTNIPGCMLIVGLLISWVFLRHGHGWLVAILFLYYAAALVLIAVGGFLRFTPGFC